MTEKKYLNPEARAAARYWGAECAANAGTSFSADYAEDCALKYGKKSWAELSQAEKNEARTAFNEGIRAEKALQGK